MRREGVIHTQGTITPACPKRTLTPRHIRRLATKRHLGSPQTDKDTPLQSSQCSQVAGLHRTPLSPLSNGQRGELIGSARTQYGPNLARIKQPGSRSVSHRQCPAGTMLEQPDSRPISHDQLAAEVQGIYAGLVMVETKCVKVVSAQAAALRAKKSADTSGATAEDHWHALIALHRSLLHEHHDFFLASQHPSASSALRELASKYSMPARMWKHGIHNFLELLRHRLPASLDYMLAFIYLAYQMMALLYETVTSFEDTWIECLGDLARHRMAIEDEGLEDREFWTGVARYWYCKAFDKKPLIGRLYHSLAILARTHPLQQSTLYSRALSAVSVFTSTRESIMRLFDPILAGSEKSFSGVYDTTMKGDIVACNSNPTPDQKLSPRQISVEIYPVQCQAIIFTKGPADRFEKAFSKLTSQLDTHIGRVTMKWKGQGMFMSIALQYGTPASSHHRQKRSEGNEATLIFKPSSDLPDVQQRSCPLFNTAIGAVFNMMLRTLENIRANHCPSITAQYGLRKRLKFTAFFLITNLASGICAIQNLGAKSRLVAGPAMIPSAILVPVTRVTTEGVSALAVWISIVSTVFALASLVYGVTWYIELDNTARYSVRFGPYVKNGEAYVLSVIVISTFLMWLFIHAANDRTDVGVLFSALPLFIAIAEYSATFIFK